MSASIRIRVRILPQALTDLIGLLGEWVRRGFPDSSIIAPLGGSLRDIRDTWGLTKDAMAGSPRILESALGVEGRQAPSPPEANMLATHHVVSTNSRKAQQTLGKLVNQGRHAVHKASEDQLPETERPPGRDDPLGGDETRAFAKARHRSLRSNRIPPAAANGLAPCHTRIRVRGNWRELHVDCGTHGSEVPPAAIQSMRTPDTHASTPEPGQR